MNEIRTVKFQGEKYKSWEGVCEILHDHLIDEDFNICGGFQLITHEDENFINCRLDYFEKNTNANE